MPVSKKGAKPVPARTPKVALKQASKGKGAARPLSAAQAKQVAPKVAHTRVGSTRQAAVAQTPPARPKAPAITARNSVIKPAAVPVASRPAPATPMTQAANADPAGAHSSALPPILK